MQRKSILILLLIIFLGPTDSLAFSPSNKYLHRDLVCPPIETTELMGQPGAVFEMENGQLKAECGYFVKGKENNWSSALIVRATWVEDPKAEQFDCRWKDKEDPFKYRISKATQAYAEVVTYDRQRYSHSFDALQHIFGQVKNLALPCPGKGAITAEKSVPVPGRSSSDTSKKKADQADASKTKDDDRSRYEAACQNGNADACNRLGVMYATGKGVVPNIPRAAKLYRKACDCGSAVGCANLGYIYQYGKDGTQDYVSAIACYKKACDGGNAGGCTNLGLMYEKGHGVNQDNMAAAHYYKKGCDDGNAAGCTNLGYMYEFGYGVNEDKKLAADYYQKGCDSGNARGCGNLGWMYYGGSRTATDRVRGKNLLERACKMGYEQSCNKLKEIRK